MLFDDEKTNTIIISIIWGFGIATIFRKICNNNKCIVIKAPTNMDSYYQKKNKKCYNFSKENTNC